MCTYKYTLLVRVFSDNYWFVKMEKRSKLYFRLIAALTLLVGVCEGKNGKYISAVGDPGMRRDGLRVAIESWNQCNEVGEEAPNMGSPRMADCFNVKHWRPHSKFSSLFTIIYFHTTESVLSLYSLLFILPWLSRVQIFVCLPKTSNLLVLSWPLDQSFDLRSNDHHMKRVVFLKKKKKVSLTCIIW